MLGLFSIQCPVRYKIVNKIFEGGMGVVYEAEQHGASGFIKRVAIKVIRQSYANQKLFIENFIGEAKLVADLIHTNIVQTYHLGETDGTFFIAMEMIRGANVEQFIVKCGEQNRQLPKDLAVFIASRIARGLAYAHAKADKDGKTLGIVHRDINLKNVMISFEGDVKVTDFGIAKASGLLQDQEGEVLAGKVDYMSPEQSNFQITDKRSDIFSVGIVLAQLLLGHNIFKGSSMSESCERVQNMAIPDFRTLDPRIDEPLNKVIHKCLERDLSKRYPNADELLQDLEHYIYDAGYGPTNETMGRFIRQTFGQVDPKQIQNAKGNTVRIDEAVQVAKI